MQCLTLRIPKFKLKILLITIIQILKALNQINNTKLNKIIKFKMKFLIEYKDNLKHQGI